MYRVENDIMKHGLNVAINEIEKLERAIILSNTQLAKVISQEGVAIANRNASSMVTHPDSVEELAFCLQNTSNIINAGTVTQVEISNPNEEATYVEYGTGVVGLFEPHPRPNSYGGKGSSWRYDMNDHGFKGWWYTKDGKTRQFTRGIPSQPFMWQTKIDVKKSLSKWYKQLLRRNMKGGVPK